MGSPETAHMPQTPFKCQLAEPQLRTIDFKARSKWSRVQINRGDWLRKADGKWASVYFPCMAWMWNEPRKPKGVDVTEWQAWEDGKVVDSGWITKEPTPWEIEG